jgi:hypothetical protein
MIALKPRGPRLFAAICILVCSTSAESRASAQKETCELHQVVSISLDVAENGQILVPVEINKTPAFMYLEIGSPFSSLSQQTASRFKLLETEMGKVIEVKSGGKRVAQYTDMDFMLGELSYRQARFLIDPHSETSRYSRPEVIGILGMDLLWKMDLELDLAHHKLNLYDHSHCGNQIFHEATNYGVVPLQRNAFGNIFFPMELDGRKLETLLTTASRETTLSTDAAKRVYGFDKDSSGIESVTDKDGHQTPLYRAMKLTASGLTLTDEKVRLCDPPNNTCHLARKGEVIGYAGCLYQYPLRLGSDFFSRLHVYINTQENLMYYTANTEGVSH